MLLFTCAFLATACIERSNPFDPINNRTEAAAEIRNQDRNSLKALIDAGSAFTAFLAAAEILFGQHLSDNAGLVGKNAGVQLADSLVRAGNQAVADFNKVQTNADSLRFMTPYGSMDTLPRHVLGADFDNNRIALRARFRDVSNHIDDVNRAHFPLVIYSREFADSAMLPLVRDSLSFARLRFRADSANEAVYASNLAIHAYNKARALENETVTAYNKTIEFRKLTRNENVIVRSDSLLSNIAMAKAGDTLYLGPGTFNVDLRFNNSGTPDSPIVVRGYPGRETIIRPSLSGVGSSNALVISKDQKYIHFESLVFRGGQEGTVKLENNATKISFHNCLFDSSQGPGLEAYDSDLKMENCEVRANAGHGVRVGGGPTERTLTFINVLFARNGGDGLQGTSQRLVLTKCTLANNGNDGIQLISPSQEINITNSILAFNQGFGVNRQAVVDYQDRLKAERNILFQNGINWGLDAMEDGARAGIIQLNSILDPDFIDPVTFNYNPRPGSYLDTLQNQTPPNIIGYRKAAP